MITVRKTQVIHTQYSVTIPVHTIYNLNLIASHFVLIHLIESEFKLCCFCLTDTKNTSTTPFLSIFYTTYEPPTNLNHHQIRTKNRNKSRLLVAGKHAFGLQIKAQHDTIQQRLY